MQASRVRAGTRTDRGRAREALKRDAYLKNALLVDAEPVEPGTRELALFDEVAP
jgi:hypothetical protein